jgi:nitrite reductase/ring-hydroxylating ferredoxin subunit
MKIFEPDEDYYKVCSIADLKEKTGKRYFINDTEVALFKMDEVVYALGNICPHQHSAVIYDGNVEEGHVTCPVHGWKFNLKDGRQPGGFRGLESYDVIISEDNVYVKVVKKELKW